MKFTLNIISLFIITILTSTISFAQADDNMEGYLTTDSGLRVKFYNPGTGDFAAPGDNVVVHYTGKLLDGTVFDSSIDRKKPISFELGAGKVIKGWEEGIALLKKGGQATFIIPSSLAYGSVEKGNIPANSTLIFDVSLLDIQKAAVIPRYDITGKIGLETTSGLKYYIINKGEGEKAIAGRNVIIHYSGYLKDGKMFDSSVKKGQPFKFTLGTGNLMKGLDEGVQLMSIGDKFSFELPPELGFGEKANSVIPANSTLIFDVELLEIEEEIILIPFDVKDKRVYTTDSGLKYAIAKEGDGITPKQGQKVTLHYTGYLLDGTIFDSSVRRGEKFSFVLGEGKVIKGWEEGIALMKIGDRIRFTIPPDLAYGERNAGSIPPNSTLIFDVELFEVK